MVDILVLFLYFLRFGARVTVGVYLLWTSCQLVWTNYQSPLILFLLMRTEKSHMSQACMVPKAVGEYLTAEALGGC